MPLMGSKTNSLEKCRHTAIKQCLYSITHYKMPEYLSMKLFCTTSKFFLI